MTVDRGVGAADLPRDEDLISGVQRGETPTDLEKARDSNSFERERCVVCREESEGHCYADQRAESSAFFELFTPSI